MDWLIETITEFGDFFFGPGPEPALSKAIAHGIFQGFMKIAMYFVLVGFALFVIIFLLIKVEELVMWLFKPLTKLLNRGKHSDDGEKSPAESKPDETTSEREVHVRELKYAVSLLADAVDVLTQHVESLDEIPAGDSESTEEV